MAGDNVVAQMGVQFSRLEQLVTVQLAEHGAKVDILAVRMDGLKREMRLMWGAVRGPGHHPGPGLHAPVLALRFGVGRRASALSRSGGGEADVWNAPAFGRPIRSGDTVA